MQFHSQCFTVFIFKELFNNHSFQNAVVIFEVFYRMFLNSFLVYSYNRYNNHEKI